jgi:hypothetical protein
MKIRKGFVSNSSSSSFICEVCGEIEGGWDASLSDVGMFECENGHVFCEGHALHDYDSNHEDYDGCYDVPAKYCPICQMEAINDTTLLSFLIAQDGVKRSDLETKIKEQFGGNYEQFIAFINTNTPKED